MVCAGSVKTKQLSERDFLVNEHLPLCHLAKSLGAKVMWGRLCPHRVFPGPQAWHWTLKRQMNECIADLTTSRQNAPADSGFQARGRGWGHPLPFHWGSEGGGKELVPHEVTGECAAGNQTPSPHLRSLLLY